ncbi:hypothetical protein ASZ90_017310 [hydrocarbon metagenome]|uniref:Uncharacterized protein n=1 Tax=hydrocarbon metagenome TaxID=938273 RepID=A0A0W8E9D8_9ZZZZ
MKILINIKNESLKRYSKITGIQFESLDTKDTNDAVAIVLQGDDFQTNLDKALGLDIPIVTVAGYENSQDHQYAIEAGIPDEAILVVRGDMVTNQGEFQFPKKKGVKVNNLMEVCKYVHKNNILPEIYIWLIPEPEHDQEEVEIWRYKDNAEETADRPVEKPMPNPADVDPEFKITNDIRQQPGIQKHDKPKNKQINQMPIKDFTKQYKKIVAVLKTNSGVNSGSIVKKITANLKGFHLEMVEKPASYKCYAEPINNAVQSSNYGYLKDQEVIYSTSGFDTLVIEVEPTQNILAIMESIMPNINYIIHLTGSYDKNKSDIDAWISMGLPIYGILPVEDEEKYRKKYPDLIKDINEISKL